MPNVNTTDTVVSKPVPTLARIEPCDFVVFMSKDSEGIVAHFGLETGHPTSIRVKLGTFDTWRSGLNNALEPFFSDSRVKGKDGLTFVVQNPGAAHTALTARYTEHPAGLEGLARQGSAVLFQSFDPEWVKRLASVAIAPGNQTPNICFYSDTLSFPWEFLHLGRGIHLIDDASDTADLRSVLADFLGFKFSIYRDLEREKDDNTYTSNLLAPPRIGLVIHPDLAALPQSDLTVLRTLEKNGLIKLDILDLDTSRPERIQLENAVAFVRAKDFDVLHFMCHAGLENIGGINTVALHISSHLSLTANDLAYLSKEPRDSEILVFFNACNTGITRYNNSINFVNLFRSWLLKSHIIATEFGARTDLAPSFTSAFYSNWLEHVSIGQALISARKALLEQDIDLHLSVLRLIYSLYGGETGYQIPGKRDQHVF
ncbi:MAG: CHAT domain-containing protein [Bacteroidota bacterium]